MDLFDLSAKISLDTSNYDKGLNESESKMSGFGDKLKKGLGTAAKVGAAALTTIASSAGAVTTEIYKMVMATGEHADEIDKQSQKLGLSREAYQEWDYVLSQSGADISSMTTGVKTLTNKIADATSGGEDSVEMFKQLGISLDDLQSKSREDIFKATIKGLQKLDDNADRAALANKLLGRSAVELTPLFNETAESTDELIEKAHEYGMVMSDEAIQAGVDMQDSLDTLKRSFDGVKNNLAQEFLPSFKTVIDGMTDLFAGKEGAADKISSGISQIANNILEKTPEIINMVVPIIKGMAKAIVDNAPAILGAGKEILKQIVAAIPEALTMITDFLKSAQIPKLVSDIVGMLIENVPQIIDAGVDLFSTLLDDIVSITVALAENVGPLLTKLFEKITQPEFLQKIIDGGINLFKHLLDGTAALVEGLVDGAFALLDGILNLFTSQEGLEKLASAAFNIMKSLVDSMVEALGKIAGILWKAVEKVYNGLLSIFETNNQDDLWQNPSKFFRKTVSETVIPNESQLGQALLRGGYASTGDIGEGTGGRGVHTLSPENYDIPNYSIIVYGDVKAEDVANEVVNRIGNRARAGGMYAQ